MIGKRKRDAQVVARSESSAEQNTAPAQASDHFRQYFESQFKPLQELSTNVNESVQSDEHDYVSLDDASLSDWEGLSGDESIPQVEVIEFGKKQESSRLTDNLQLAKAFMTAKPPVLDDSMPVSDKHKKHDQDSTEETAAEAINLKHDLELQRLLKESHLLDRSSNPSLSHTHRHKAIDLRIQSLGANSSLYRQEKMPPAHRRGIVAKASHKEATRRQEAIENGIILEKEATARNGKSVRRERGVGGPAIGKFEGGTLKLSRKDIDDIQGPKRSQGIARKRRK